MADRSLLHPSVTGAVGREKERERERERETAEGGVPSCLGKEDGWGAGEGEGYWSRKRYG